MAMSTSTKLQWETEGDAWSSHGIKKGDPDVVVAYDGSDTFEISVEGRVCGGYPMGTIYRLAAEVDGEFYESIHNTLTAAQAAAEGLR